MSRRILFVDPCDLVGEKGVVAEVVIDAGRPQINNRNRPMLLVYEPLGFNFGNTMGGRIPAASPR